MVELSSNILCQWMKEEEGMKTLPCDDHTGQEQGESFKECTHCNGQCDGPVERSSAVEVSIYRSVYLTHQRHSKGKIKQQSQRLNGWKPATIFHVEFVTDSTNFHAKIFWPQIYSLLGTTNFDRKHTSQKYENLSRNVMWFLAGMLTGLGGVWS